MKRSGCRRELLRGESLTDTLPCEGEFHGGHHGAESLGGVGGSLGCRGVGGLGCGPARGVQAGRGFGGGCCGHWVRGISLGVVGWKARPQILVAAQAGKSHWLVTVLEAYDGRSAIEATVEPSALLSRNQGTEIPDGRRASIGMRDGAARGTHIHIEERRKNIEKNRTGSAVAPMWVGVGAELGSAWVRRLAAGCSARGSSGGGSLIRGGAI